MKQHTQIIFISRINEIFIFIFLTLPIAYPYLAVLWFCVMLAIDNISFLIAINA